MEDYVVLKSNSENSFYPVSVQEISEVENSLGFQLPEELRKFYLEIGYGFIKGSEYNVNRIMDPYSVKDFRLRQNEYKSYPDIDIYDLFEEGKLIFFEANESSLVSIGLKESNENAIFYYNVQIASSLKEFLSKIQKNDMYYIDLIDKIS